MSLVSPDPLRPRRGGRPTAEQAARLDQMVHERALEEFLTHGYDGTSMDAVAASAGTTKATLYARFAGKQAMFVAVLRWAVAQPDWPVPEVEPLGIGEVRDLPGLTAVLSDVAATALRRAMHPQMIQLTRLATTHFAQFPELAEHSRRLSSWRRYDRLVGLLRRLRAEGVITTDEDPELLAEHFFAMVAGMPARLALFGVVRSEEDQARRAGAAVRFFVDGLRP